MEENKISVAMATYNGEKYIKEQIDSILINLKEYDEIIISDDGSTDNTIQIIKQYNDERIKVIEGPKKGVKKNFENAIRHTQGDFIFLCDQDDIWKENKVEKVLEKFNEDNKITMIVHDAIVFNSEDNNVIYDSFFKFRNSGSGILKNIYKNTYIGCCMAFRASIKEKILPIPNNIEMHDQWIGIINEKKCGKTVFLNEKLLMYRRHLDNVSEMHHYPLVKMIKNRCVFIYEVLKNIVK